MELKKQSWFLILILFLEMKREERMHKQRAEEARLAKQRVAEHKEITKAELTRGVLEYKRLGIDYAKLSDRSKTRYVIVIFFIKMSGFHLMLD